MNVDMLFFSHGLLFCPLKTETNCETREALALLELVIGIWRETGCLPYEKREVHKFDWKWRNGTDSDSAVTNVEQLTEVADNN